jgi:thioredoxin reductase
MTDGRHYPPDDYPLVIVGTGPGGLQLSYELRALGVDHALISKDSGPGGMFRRFPMFGRLITCSRPHAIVECGCLAYYRYDWNSMVTMDPAHQALVTEFMDGDNYFPSRAEMESALTAFSERGGVTARYGCDWESTRQEDDGRFVLSTSDGEYRAKLVVFAVGMIEPWRPPTPGIEAVPHYVDIADTGIEHLAGKKVFIIGKRNSAFEIANGLLAKASQLILGSPHGVRPSIATGFPTPPRARYLQPLEDALFGGGTFVVDVALERIERTADGYRVHADGTTGLGKVTFEVDEVIACTGFATGLRDLRKLGVETFYKDRLPTQTPYWESTTVPGIYFAGAATQGQAGMRKYGWPSHSASVGGFRFNAKVQAAHIAREHFGIEPPRPEIDPRTAADYLLDQATSDSAIWSQHSNLARQLTFQNDAVLDDGIVVLLDFVDSSGPDAVAITVETNLEGHLQPCAYVRRGGDVSEEVFGPAWMNDFRTDENRSRLTELCAGLGR